MSTPPEGWAAYWQDMEAEVVAYRERRATRAALQPRMGWNRKPRPLLRPVPVGLALRDLIANALRYSEAPAWAIAGRLGVSEAEVLEVGRRRRIRRPFTIDTGR